MTSWSIPIGGRWLVSWRRTLVMASLALIGIAPDAVRIGGGSGLGLFTAVVLAAMVNALFDLVMHLGPWADRAIRPVHPVWAILRFVGGGCLFAAAIEAAESFVAEELTRGSWRSFVIYPTISLWVSVATIAMAHTLSEARRLRETAVAERAEAMEASERARRAKAQLDQEIDERLADKFGALRSELEGLGDTMSASTTGVGLSTAIRKVADESVRTTGHQLWRRADGDVVRIGVRDILRDLVFRQRLRPLSLIGMAVVLPLVKSVSADDFGVLVGVGSIATVVTVVECWAANSLMLRWPASRVVVIPVMVALFIVHYELTILIDTEGVLASSSMSIFELFVWTVVLIAVTSAIGSYRDLDALRAVSIASSVREERLATAAEARVVSTEARRLAQLLHGNVQSRLLGCAMAVEFAGDDPVMIRQALDRTLAVIDDGWRVAPEFDTSDHPTLEALREIWSGVAEVSVSIDGDVPRESMWRVATAAEELVANAVRHGNARHVDVKVTADSRGVAVRVVDDGTGVADERPGLGSRILEHLGSIERRTLPTGTCATVHLAT
jgi:signal transduction histidine kinase